MRSLLAVAGIASLAGSASAEDISIGAFAPTPSTAGGGFQVETPDVGKSGNWVATSVLSYATNLLVIDAKADGATVSSDRAIAKRYSWTLGGAYAFLDRFEAGLALPLYMQSGEGAMQPLHVADASGQALGDLAIHAKAAILRREAFAVGASAHVTLPTASDGQYTGVDLPTGRVLALGSFTRERFAIDAMAGAVVRKRSVYRDVATIAQGSGFVFGVGASVRAANRLWFSTEIFGEVIASGRDELGANELRLSPIEALAGATYRTEHFTIGAAIGRGVTTGIGSPDIRGVFSIGYTGDAQVYKPLREPPPVVEDKPVIVTKPPVETDADPDGDGILGEADKCPTEPETINGTQDDDGCPDEGGASGPAIGDGSPTKAAEATFEAGRRLMKEKKYREACAAFEQSQRLDPQFGTQYNLANCYEQIGKLATAYNMYRELGRGDTNADRRTKSTELAVQILARVPKIKLVLVTNAPDAQVFMNDANANALIGIETPVDFGTYNIVVGATGYRAWRKSFEIRELSKVTTVTIELQKK